MDILKQLLSHPNIDVNQINTRNGKTSLMIATEEGHIDVVKLLLRHPQIKTNEKDYYHRSAIEEAKSRGYLRIAKLFLRCPQTIKVTIKQNFTSNSERELKEIIEAEQMLDSLVQMDASCCLNVTQELLLSANEGDFRAIRGLLQCPNSDVNAINDKTRTPLHLVSMMGNVEPLKALLASRFIDVNKVTSLDGGSAFSVASQRGNFEIMRVLLQNASMTGVKMSHKTDVNKGWDRDAWTSSEIKSMLMGKGKESQQPESVLSSGEVTEIL